MMMTLEGGAGSEQKRTSTAQTLKAARTKPQSKATNNRSQTTTTLPTRLVSADRLPKRPAEYPNRSESNKRHRGSPRKEDDPDIQIWAVRKVSGAFDDQPIRSAPSTPRKSSAGFPSAHNRIVPGTDPVPQKRKRFDLTVDDDSHSPLASRSNKTREVVDLTGDDDRGTQEAARSQRRSQVSSTRYFLRPDRTPEFATPSRASRSATIQKEGLLNLFSKNDLALDLPQRDVVDLASFITGPETRSQRLKRQNSLREETLPVLSSHEQPASVSKNGDADPTTPQRNAGGDSIFATQTSNTDELLQPGCHTGGLISNINGPNSDDVFVEDGQLLDQDETSDDNSDETSDDSSDEEYTPCKRLPKFSGNRIPKLPRVAKPTKVVNLRVLSEKGRLLLLRLAQRPELPIGDKCFFLRLPLEVLRQIYRCLLLATGPIRVLNGWSRLSRLQKRERLRPAILSVSRPIFDQAMRVLYSENVFQYLVRDIKDDNMVYLPSSRTIAVKNYARYFRQLEVVIDRNRTEPGYGDTLARALATLRNNGASLYKLRINVSPRIEEDMAVSIVGWFEQGGLVNIDLKALRTCFIHIHLTTPKTDSDTSKTFRYVIDKRSEVSELELYQRRCQPRDGSSFMLSGEEVRGLIHDEQANKANSQLDQLSAQISMACCSPELAMQQKWFEQSEATWCRIDYADQDGPENLNDEDFIHEDADA